MKLRLMLITIFILAISINAEAGISVDVLTKCTPSYEANNKFYPGEDKVGKTNDLHWKTGSPYAAEGKLITVTGKVVDENCLPIQNAAVEIWHADSAGKYVGNDEDPSRDEYFAGSGLAYTNNMGLFKFYTILPGSEGENKTPYINFKVRSGENSIQTRMYFPGEELNDFDPEFTNLTDEQKDMITASRFRAGTEEEYAIDIILKGKVDKFKKY